MTAGPDIVTVTPGKMAPCSSLTLPTSSPNSWPVCATAGMTPTPSTRATTPMAQRNRLTCYLLEKITKESAGFCWSEYAASVAFYVFFWAIDEARRDDIRLFGLRYGSTAGLRFRADEELCNGRALCDACRQNSGPVLVRPRVHAIGHRNGGVMRRLVAAGGMSMSLGT